MSVGEKFQLPGMPRSDLNFGLGGDGFEVKPCLASTLVTEELL